jgi:hypothetical protein
VVEFVRRHDVALALLPELALGYACNGAHKKATRALALLGSRIEACGEALPVELGLQVPLLWAHLPILALGIT